MADLRKFSKSSITNILNISFLAIILFSFTGCQIIGDIFKAGVWVGVIIVVIVIALLIWIIRRFL
jgi:hypothetical protein